MKYQFIFEKGSVVADLDLVTILELHARLIARDVNQVYAWQLLHQIAYFGDNRDSIVDEYGGSTVVIANDHVVMHGTTPEVFGWLSNNHQFDPVYVTEVPNQSEASRHILQLGEPVVGQLPVYDFTAPSIVGAGRVIEPGYWHTAEGNVIYQRASEVYDA